MKKIVNSFYLILFTYSISFCQISLDGIGTYSQDFNSLSNSGTSSTVPIGWAFSESGTSSNNDGLYTAGTGSSNQGDTYSFGSTSSTERAFGGLQSGTLLPTIGASFINNTGFTITQIPIAYTGEQWRLGTLSRTDQLDFQISTDATSLITGTWTDVDNLDFTAPVTSGTVGLLDGNATGNRTFKTFTIIGLSIADGTTFWIRWSDFNATGADDGLAIDDFSIDETNLPVELSSFSAIVLDDAIKLNWRTETEVSNFGFDIERSDFNPNSEIRNPQFSKIGFVQGNGNSNSPKDYSLIDEDVVAGNYFYRLKQIDTDGQFEYSKIINVDLDSPSKFELSQNYPNPFNPTTTISFTLPQSGDVTLKVYNAIGEQVAELINGFKEAGVHTINFDGSELRSGVYFYRLKSEQKVENRKMILLK